MNKTRIEWAEAVWNPVTGCTPISEGCQNCYARRMAYRLRGRCGYPQNEPFKVTLHPERLNEPLKWKKPKRVFVCSMGDLFHEDVDEGFLCRVFDVMMVAKQHIFLILTKRPERMKRFFEQCVHGERNNLWLGVTAENQARADERIPILLQIPAAVRFVSVEPMLGPVDLKMYLPRLENGWPAESIDWVICGGETGPKARPMHPNWVRSLRDQCKQAGVPFFFKSWGEWAPICDTSTKIGDICMSEDGFIDTVKEDYVCCANESDGEWMRKVGKKAAGRMLDGRTWDEMPEV